jgi:hypothetical protein
LRAPAGGAARARRLPQPARRPGARAFAQARPAKGRRRRREARPARHAHPRRPPSSFGGHDRPLARAGGWRPPTTTASPTRM